MKSFCVRTIELTLALIFLLQPISTYALISDGANAVDQIGQYTDYTLTTNSYTKIGGYNSPNEIGLDGPWGTAMDTVGHRLFVANRIGNKVFVYNLNSSNILVDKVADYVLGQSDFFGSTAMNTQSGLNGPQGLAYDSVNSRLFVVEQLGNRVKVFDVATITNGEPAINVLGQADFTSSIATSTQSGMNSPTAVVYDSSNSRLFVAENTHRVKIFDVTSITDGENATYVLGQTTFTGAGTANTQVGMNSPNGLAYDAVNSRLFVAEQAAHRVKIFDVATTSNGKPASFVLGQTSFSGTSASSSQSGFVNPYGLAYDSINSRLFVAELNGNRIKVFDVASTTNGEPAVNILGQSDYTSSSSANTQSGLSDLRSLLYDEANSRLYVSERSVNRIKVFDVASITDGENAIDLIGQYTDSFNFIPSYIKTAIYNSPNEIGFNVPTNMVMDKVNHRLFVSDGVSGGRILVYNLSASNVLIDKAADYVLGQTDFISYEISDTSSSLRTPRGLAYDEVNSRLFVSENSGNRVKVFDVSTIVNNEPAINILGQSDFTASTSANTQTGLNSPQDLEYDSVNSRLFVSEQAGNRIKVFDVASITNGEPAINIIGQSDYSSFAAADSQTGLRDARAILYIPEKSQLLVAEGFSGNRIKVFDVASIVDGEPAINILGQTDYTSGTATDTQSGLNVPRDMAYDSSNSRLFVTENIGNRIKIFDIATITDGEPAINILGQPDYTSSSSANTQSGLNAPFGIVYDQQNGLLYVTETGGNRIKIFDAYAPPTVVVSTSTPVMVQLGFQGPTGYGGSSSAYVSSVNEVTVPTQSPIPQVTSSFTFTKTLQTGMTHPEVKTLQQYLNAKGFNVAKTGPGSAGKETNFFGAATRASLIKFQKANKITPAVGYFGPVTRAYILSK